LHVWESQIASCAAPPTTDDEQDEVQDHDHAHESESGERVEKVVVRSAHLAVDCMFPFERDHCSRFVEIVRAEAHPQDEAADVAGRVLDDAPHACVRAAVVPESADAPSEASIGADEASDRVATDAEENDSRCTDHRAADQRSSQAAGDVLGSAPFQTVNRRKTAKINAKIPALD
jgi:hypothetical protein